eukprot:1484688-Ditylum_brightwellii.AAC.1
MVQCCGMQDQMNYGMAAPRIATQAKNSTLSSYYSTQWKIDMSMVGMLVFFNIVMTERESGFNSKQKNSADSTHIGKNPLPMALADR